MEVDLQRMKKEIERELRDLEWRRSELKNQMRHIEAVEQLAGSPGNSRGDVDSAAEQEHYRQAIPEGIAGEEGKSWFRR